ncbi:FHF complex subunit HOOK-interacting protein 2B isoform X1 [Lepisosteus oculatus]|uniref:FHF complex subunit HOOK-interacting protein 2B isoform X1 n=2 Tax=Lepisosteus oculatus TaxID=7918 RepID=UPI0035F51FFC
MEMFSKLTALFQEALETREPSVNLLESFVDHWKGITNYYIETSDEMTPAKQTDIPWRLKQMLDILVYEEKQQEMEETGPCMEYLLQHKVLETLCTLGKAQYPPGMNQQVLIFFTKLLGQIQQPMLHIINVHRPVQKLIRLCGAVSASQTEKDEVQFLFVICFKLKQDPYVLNYILEREKSTRKPSCTSGEKEKEGGMSPQGSGDHGGQSVPSSPLSDCTAAPSLAGGDPGACSSHSHPTDPSSPPAAQNAQTNLVSALVNLAKSQKSRVALKACEGLLLLASIPKEENAIILTESAALCELLTDRLCDLYTLIPTSVDPTDIQTVNRVYWRVLPSQNGKEETCTFPGKEHVEAFLTWLDFCDQLVKDTPRVLASRLAKAVHQQWLTAVMQPQLLQISEVGVLVATALLFLSVRQISAPLLLEELVFFLLGSRREPEARMDTETHALRFHLIEHCDHISDEISLATLRLFEELLQKPHEHIVFSLVLRNLEQRSYIAQSSGGAEDRPAGDTEHLDESEELEEDPFFTDMYPESEFNTSNQLLALPPRTTKPRPPGKTQVTDIVNSFVCLVPQEAKTSHCVQESGYDTYVHDAHELFKECTSYSLQWGWPKTPKPQESVHPNLDFYEGHFLKVLFDRITRILDQPYELNLQVTSVLSKLAVFPHPHLHEYLLDPYISLAPGSRSLFSVLIRVIGDLMQRIQHIPHFSEKLLFVRKQLMGLEHETMTDHMTLLKGVIVLEEFCKELAAIAFVKYPTEEH